jgi:acyl transferase domain-containing protein
VTPDAPVVPPEDEVAVVGMACRFPGAPDVASFWRLLLAGEEAVRTYSDEELRAAGVAEELLRDPCYVRAAGHLEGIDRFDADFFGCSPREAELMDPQHRLFLEVAWEALEDAGCDPQRCEGPVGVFAGTSANRYFLFHLFCNPAASDGDGPDDWASPLVAHSTADYLPVRASYLLGLNGPSVAVQSACSSSLVAVALASQSLLDWRCDVALAGGSSIVSTRPAGYRHRMGGTLSPDGHCRVFDARAAGGVPSSGAGVVVLKRHADALEAGDRVWAVLRGWAVNNDGGARAGFAVPGVDGEAAVVVEALGSCGVEPETIGYVEAHGSGTPVGDAIEVEALSRAFGRPAQRTGWCELGSVRSNLGSLDAAAGVAGLIKSLLALHRGVIPPMANYERPHPDLDLASSPFVISREPVPWPRGAAPRRAGVSSFGLGGTNAHVVLEEAPVVEPTDRGREIQLLVVSARSETALEAAVQRLREHLVEHPEVPLADVAFTLCLGRRVFERRAALVYGESPDGRAVVVADHRGAAAPGAARPVVFVFERSGEPAVAEARSLCLAEPAFRRAVEECGALGHGLESPGDVPRFVVEYAVARLLRAWGIAPAGAVGEGVGAWVAAALAGRAGLEQAVTAVASGEALALAAPAAPGDAVLRIGPGPSLCSPAGLLDAVAQLWAAGSAVSWNAYFGGERRRRVSLPTYPFQRRRYWIEAAR